MSVNMTDLSIFTNNNENGIKLSDRLNMVLTNAQYFDALVGYFRLTGFYLLEEKLKDVEEVRILIGLGVDKQTVDVFSSANAIIAVKQKVQDEFNKTDDDSVQMENGISKLIDWMVSGKVKIRMCYERNVHAKVYIVRKNPAIVPDQFGNLITGSSNFSYNGLEKNVEFNVELKNKNDVEYGLQFFDDLWKQSLDITDDLINTIKEDTWMNKHITPYEMFLKTIFTYFEEEIHSDDETYDWPDDYMRLQYQEHAVTQARKILAKHGGVFISDVVGLGKTYIAAMLGKLLPGRKLFIVPPVVKDNWQDVLEDFGYLMKNKVVSAGILDQIVEWDNLDEYKYVFVDEAHRFRNASTSEFDNLKRICFNKGVILITATPQNNTISDIANLITLFQDSKKSSIMPECSDLNAYFSEMKTKLSAAKGTDEYQDVINEVANNVRDNVLRHVLIRRTRSEIIKYYSDDLAQQGLVFPKLHDPICENYMYDDDMEDSFNKTIEIMKKFTYARFSPLLYLKNKSLIGSNKQRQENMKGFIKTMLIKRLESSIYAFSESIKRLKLNSEEFIGLYNAGRIPVGAASKKGNIAELIGMSDEDYNAYIDLKEIDAFKPEDFNSDFIKNVKYDDDLLNELYDVWSKYDLTKQDPKYDVLKKELDTLYKDHKVIIFSEAADTVDYLTNRLEADYGDIVVEYTGSDNQSKKTYIRKNFDPKFTDRNVDDKSILVATDALSEGINLHKASILINYDLPWNPTRVMQRTGRINRVGSKNSDLYVYNFFPRANVKEHLSLEDSIKAKVQMFHDLLGEDAKVITDDETISSYELYDYFMMVNKLPDEDDLSTNAIQMSFVQMVKKLKKDNPKLYEKIENLPEKIRVARNYTENGLITFIKQGLIKKFIMTNGSISKEIDFETAIKYIQTTEDEKGVELPDDYFEMLSMNKRCFADCLNQSQARLVGVGKKDSINEKKTKQYISFLMRSIDLFTNEKEYVVKVDAAIKRGTFNAKIYRDIITAIGKTSDVHAIVKALQSVIDPIYLEERKNYALIDSLKSEKVVVLSECYIKESK